MLNRTPIDITSEQDALKLFKQLDREEKRRNKELRRKNPAKSEVVQFLRLRCAKTPLFLPTPWIYDPNSSESRPLRALEEMKELLNDAAKLFDEGRTLGAFQKVFEAGCRWGEYNVWKEAREGVLQKQKESKKNLNKVLRPLPRQRAIVKAYRELRAKHAEWHDTDMANEIKKKQEKERLWSGEGENVGTELIRKEIRFLRKKGLIK